MDFADALIEKSKPGRKEKVAGDTGHPIKSSIGEGKKIGDLLVLAE
jgi:hypothetical protein